MRKRLFVLTCFASALVSARDFSKNYFVGTQWFCNNADSAFYRSDTLKFVKYSNREVPEWSDDKFAESESSYLGHGDFAVVHFLRFGDLEFSKRWNNYMTSVHSEKHRWIFDRKTSEVTLFRDSIALSKFRPLREHSVKVASGYAIGPDSLSTVELTCVRIK